MAPKADDCTMLGVALITSLVIFCSLLLMYPTMVKGPLEFLEDSLNNLRREGFIEYPGYPTTQLCKMPLTTPDPKEYGPADASITSLRTPYHLLGDYMDPASSEPRLANLTSECAYIADGQRLIEQAGSYGQKTNNYKRKNPDNGTTWRHELSVSFYK